MDILKRSIPNIITLSRPVLACAFVALLPGRFLGNTGAVAPLIVFAAICLTDFVDGRIARAWGAVSRTGACLDLYSDLFYIIVSLVTLNLLGQTPVWLTAVVLAKFVEYIATSRILSRDPAVFVPDPFGRVAAGLFFIVPGLACFLYGMPGREIVFASVLSVTVILALLSSAVRCASCIKSVKKESYCEH